MTNEDFFNTIDNILNPKPKEDPKPQELITESKTIEVTISDMEISGLSKLDDLIAQTNLQLQKVAHDFNKAHPDLKPIIINDKEPIFKDLLENTESESNKSESESNNINFESEIYESDKFINKAIDLTEIVNNESPYYPDFESIPQAFKEYPITDFKVTLQPGDLDKDIELIFNFDSLDWNNFESLIKKKKSIKFDYFFNVVINYNGLYLISYLKFDDSFNAFNFISIEKEKFSSFNYDSNIPLLLEIEANDFMEIIEVIKKKSKDTVKDNIIQLTLKAQEPERLYITIKEPGSNVRKTHYGTPIRITDLETNSFQYKLIDIICNTHSESE